MKAFSLLAILVFYIACSSNKTKEEFPKPLTKIIQSLPDDFKLSKTSKEHSISILNINQLEGHISPLEISTKSGIIYYGGADLAAKYRDIVIKTYDSQIITILSGNNFIGNYNHDFSLGVDVIKRLNQLKPDLLISHSSHFNIMPPYGLMKKESDAQKSYQRLLVGLNQSVLLSNIYQIQTSQFPDWKNFIDYKIVTRNKVKIGFISIIDPETIEKINLENRRNLYFDEMLRTILLYSDKLKKLGANAIILYLDSNQICGRQQAIEVKKPIQCFEEVNQCSNQDSIYQLTKLLPSGTVDLIFNTHTQLPPFKTSINQIPFINSDKQSLSLLTLIFDSESLKIKPDKIKLLANIKLCLNHFSEYQDCFIYRSGDNSKIDSAKFLGQDINLRPLSEKKYKNIYTQKQRIKGLGYTNFYHQIWKNQVGILHQSQLAKPEDKEVIIEKYGDIQQFIKYPGFYHKIEVTNEQLKLIINEAKKKLVELEIHGEHNIDKYPKMTLLIPSDLLNHLHFFDFFNFNKIENKQYSFFEDFINDYF